jgi:RNA-binding protein Musashi
VEEKADEPEVNNAADQQMYGNEQEEDDIDFNLGNGNTYNEPAAAHHEQAHGPGIKEDG